MILLNAVASTGTSEPTNIGDAKTCFIHVYSASTSTATVKIQQSLGNDAWHTVATISNPTAEGELWKGPSLPKTRVTISAYTLGTISATADFANAEVTSWAMVDATTPTTGTFGIIKKEWTNAEIVAAGTGGTEALLDVGTIPAKSQLLSCYAIVGTQATFAAGTLTVGVGRTGATYVDFIAASSVKAAAATVYGDAAADRATDAAIQYMPAATAVKAIFTGGAGDLKDVTTSTGTIYLLYITYP